ncbi:MAG: phenylalanine--tRNA ligase subunit beta [Proteobacteria bacterium]|nr:phenylalanine--tRNA ligase subunit beta [Pseudomonadota bacterium]
MLMSLNWLKEHFAKSDIKIDARDLADRLTMRGVHVAGIKKSSNTLENVVVGKIVQIEKHPNADKLRVTQVVLSEDEGAERTQIVCGASNIAEGDIVPIALPGSVLPGDFSIKISTIRGVESKGMICYVTNYVMLEHGQPLHAFDLRRIESGSIRVGAAKEPRDFTLLSGDTVQIEPGDIVIWDGDRPIALAGIMGGLNSQIEADTTSIVLESAAFDPIQIRKTAKRLGLSTESSKRFEKASDLAAVAAASEKAAMILRDSMNANVYHPPIDTNEYGVKEHILAVDMREVRKITGLPQLTAEHASDLLDSIGISSHKKSPNVLSVRLPSFRQDLKSTIDLVEEVARLNGYEHIPQNLPLSVATFDRLDEISFEFENRSRHILFHLGLREAINYSFISDDLCKTYGFVSDSMVRIKNPISEEMKVLRTSLLPGLLQNYSYNKNRKLSSLKLFEVGKTFTSDSSEETKVKETPTVAGLLSGQHLNPHWSAQTPKVDFYYVKGLVELLVKQLTTVFLSFEPIQNMPLFHPKRAAVIKLGLKEVGYLGEIHPHIRQNVLDTHEPLVAFELNLELLRKYERTAVRYKTPSRFPGVELDLAFVVDRNVAAQTLLESIKHAGGQLLSEVSVFDVYEGETIPQTKKSLAFRLSFMSPERTLQEAEVTSARETIVKAATEKFGAQLRS